MPEATTDVTVYNKSSAPVEAGGAFWPSRKESTQPVQRHRMAEVEEHPKLEVRSDQRPVNEEGERLNQDGSVSKNQPDEGTEADEENDQSEEE